MWGHVLISFGSLMMAVRIEAGLQFCCCFLQDFEGNRLIGEMLDGTE